MYMSTGTYKEHSVFPWVVFACRVGLGMDHVHRLVHVPHKPQLCHQPNNNVISINKNK